MDVNSISAASANYQVQGSPAATTVAPVAAPVEKVEPIATISEDTGRSADSGSTFSGNSEDYKPSNETVQKAVDVINEKLGNSRAVFGIHEDTHRLTIKIVDTDTDEVKKEFPAEETLDMLAKMWDMAGIMVDEKR